MVGACGSRAPPDAISSAVAREVAFGVVCGVEMTLGTTLSAEPSPVFCNGPFCKLLEEASIYTYTI